MYKSEEFSNGTPVLGAYPSDVAWRENLLPEAADFVLGLVHRFCVVLFPFSFPSDAQTPFCREGSTLYSAGSTGRFLTIAEWHNGPKPFQANGHLTKRGVCTRWTRHRDNVGGKGL